MRMVSWLWKGGNGDDENEEDLKKKGFDPEALDVGVAVEETITDFSKDYEGFISPSPEQFSYMLKNYKYAVTYRDFFRTKTNTGTNWPTPKADVTAETKLK